VKRQGVVLLNSSPRTKEKRKGELRGVYNGDGKEEPEKVFEV